jgi:hypothetical protein
MTLLKKYRRKGRLETLQCNKLLAAVLAAPTTNTDDGKHKPFFHQMPKSDEM